MKTNFAGSGITNKGVLFSYISNWESAGRWGIELFTTKRRVFLRPIEKIYIQDRGKFEFYEHKFNNKIDCDYKPGLYRQLESLLNTPERLLNLEVHINNTKKIYKKIIQ